MPRKAVKQNIDDIADAITLKQKNNQSMVLFLGSRAGGLFRSRDFIATMKEYSIRSFDPLSREGQFAESCKVLKQDRFNDNTIHALLTRCLKPVTISEPDIYLAEFIKQGPFDVIISTNIDSLLEKALEYVGIRELYDFHVLIPGHAPVKVDRMPARMVIKVFGDVYTRGYNVTRRDFYLDSLPELKTLLEQTLSRDVLVIGFDPAWDAEVLRVITDEQENFFWLVTEEEALIKHHLLSRAIRWRHFRYLAGKIGGYEQFLKALYMYLYDKMPLYHQVMSDTSLSLKSLHSDVQIMRKEMNDTFLSLKSLQSEVQTMREEMNKISVLMEKISHYLENSNQ
jgi:hypothetical protein